MSTEISRLIESHLYVVQETVRRKTQRREWREFESIGRLALISAAASYDPDKGASFATYASCRISSRIDDELRIRTKANKALGFQRNIALEEVEDTESRDYAPLHAAIKKLPKKDRDLVYAYYGFNGEAQSLRQLASGVSYQTVRRRLKAILSKLEAILNSAD